MSKLLVISILIVTSIAFLLWKQGGHTTHESSDGNHSSGHAAPTPLTEGGQSTFSALIEIVRILEADSKTQWHKVNITGLHSHLIDMNTLMTATSFSQSIDGKQIRFDIQGPSSSIPAIHRMVPAHSKFIEQSRSWSIDAELTDTGAALIIRPSGQHDIEKLSALGFYGFMSLDSHHEAHHYQMAMGQGH